MTNQNTKSVLVAGLFLGTLLILGITIAPITVGQVNAQSKKLTCDTTKDCNIIIRRLRVGDDLIIQFKAAPPATGGGGGGGTVPQATVDQQARDDITNLKSTDAVQDNNIQRLEQQNTELQNNLQTVENQNAALKQNLTLVNEALILQTQAIQELQTVVKNITDANPFVNITIPTGNESGSGEQPNLPPQGNETTGTGENTTTPTQPPGNESSTNPPGNETTTNPPNGNESNNTIPIEGGNVTLPIEGNVTIPVEGGNVSTGGGESNVTLPIDNSTGNIIIENGTGTGTITENQTNENTGNATVSGDIVGFRPG